MGVDVGYGPAMMDAPDATPPTLFTDVDVFDSRTGKVTGPFHVLVRDGLITTVARGGLAPAGADGALVVDGRGRTLMPGLIDAHWHTTLCNVTLSDILSADVGYLHLAAGVGAEQTLLRGFTTVRDASGPAFALKRAIDEGLIPGPRIYPSGAIITQTGGHGDFRTTSEIPRGIVSEFSRAEYIGASVLADGPHEVLRAAREQLMHGASQIKIAAGGGVISAYDPIDVSEYGFEEMRAAVEAAENFGTYVLAHAYIPRSVQTALQAGVRCIEHGQLLDRATVEMIVEKDAWWCLQPFLVDEGSSSDAPSETQTKLEQVSEGTDRAYALAKELGAKVAWGTDLLFDPAQAATQGMQLARMVRWYTPAEVLSMATLSNAALVALSGPRNPYPGRLGVIEEGAYADLLLIDGNPLDDITFLTRPEASMLVIMKAGQIAQNLLSPPLN